MEKFEDITETGGGLEGLKGLNRLDSMDDKEFSDLLNSFSSPSMELIQRINSPISSLDREIESGYNIGSSMFDLDIYNIDELYNAGDVRAENQPWYAKISAGLAKGAILAGTTYLDGLVGLALGSKLFIEEGKFSAFWDNPFSKAMLEINELSELILPNYYTKDEIENPWGHVFNANFIGDKFIKNLGFAIGAFYSGNVVANGLKLTKLPLLIGLLTKSINAPKHVLSAVGATISAFNEGRIEAVNNSKDWYELHKLQLDDLFKQRFLAIDDLYEDTEIHDLLITTEELNYILMLNKLNEDRAKMGNADLLFNLPILLASNIVLFGKLYANGFKTARRANNIVERAGKLTAGTTKLGAATAVTKGATAEGLEEISQAAASRISGLAYELDVNNFFKALYDNNTEELTIDWVKAFAKGINETVNDGSAWEEFFIGTLTGALGMPRFRGLKSSEGKFQSPITLEGGAYNEWKDYNNKIARELNIADYINNRINSPETLNYYRSLIRHNKYQNDMNLAAEQGDEFSFKNAEHALLVSDIAMFDNAGRIEDLYTLLDAAYDTSDENLASIVLNTTTTLEDGSKVGPFVDKNGNPMYATPEGKQEMIDKLTQNKNDIVNTINNYLKIKNDLDIRTGLLLSDELLGELTWMKSLISNWSERATSMSGDIKSAISNVLGNLDSFLRFNEQLRDFEGQHNADLTDRYKLADENVRAIQKAINTLNLIRNYSDEALAYTLANNPKFIDGLIKEINEVDETVLNEDEKQDIVTKLNDIVKLGNASKVYNTKLKEYLENPLKQVEDHTRVHEETIREETNKKANELRTTLTSATNLKEFRSAIESLDDIEATNKFIELLEDEGNELAKNYRETSLYYLEIERMLQSSDVEPLTKKDAMRLFFDLFNNSENLLQLANPNSIYVNNENAFDEESEGDIELSATRFQNAQYELQKAISKVNNDNKFKDRFSPEYKKPVEKVETPFEYTIRKKDRVQNHKVSIASDKTDIGGFRTITFKDEIEDNKKSPRTLDNGAIKLSIDDIDIRGYAASGRRDDGTSITEENVTDDKIEEAEETIKDLLYNSLTNTQNDVMALSLIISPDGKVFADIRITGGTTRLPLKGNPLEKSKIKGDDRESTGDSQTSTVPSVDSSTLPTTEIPVGNITQEMVAEENKKTNERVETPQRPSKDSYNLFYRPAIPELHIEASKEGDFRPFDIVVSEKEKGVDFSGIYGYLRDSGAFRYVNEGNLKVGDELDFMIDPDFNDHTIFIIDKRNGQVVGSLDESDYSVSRYEGLKSLEERIRKEYINRENKTGKFIATPTTRVSKMMIGRVPYSDTERSLKDIPNVSGEGKAPIFGIIKNGVLSTNGKIDDSLIIKPVDMAQKEGRLYLLIPNGAGKYSPAAVRVKHFNNEEFNLNDVNIANTPIGKDINEAINKLANATSLEDVSLAMQDLAQDLYMQDIMVTWFDGRAGSGIVISKKVRKSDGTYEKIIINDKEQIKEDKYDIYFSTSKKSAEVGGLTIDASALEAMGDTSLLGVPKDPNNIYKEILNLLIKFNLPLQVSARRINNGAYNNRLVNSDILTSNITDASVRSTWFTTDYFDNEGNLHKSTSPASITPQPKRKVETPVGGTEGAIKGTPILVGNKKGNLTVYVDLSTNTIRNSFNRDITNDITPEEKNLYFDLAWAQDNFGDAANSSVMIDNKVLTPSGKVLNRTTGKYLEGQEAQEVKDAIEGKKIDKEAKIAKAREVIGEIYENLKRVDKTRTDSEYYYILEDDGQYHEYSRVHSVLGSNWVESDKQTEELTHIRTKLSLFADNQSQYNNYLKFLENKYKINFESYLNKTDVRSRDTIVNTVRDLMSGTNSMRALNAGTAVDSIIRQYFTIKDVSKIVKPSNMTENAFIDLITNLSKIKSNIEQRGERFLADNIVLFLKYSDGTRIAGEVDILSVDKEGNFRIYDVKTSRYSFGEFTDKYGHKVNYFTTPSPTQRMSAKDYYTLQLSAYKNLFESQYSTPITKLAIMPFVLNYDKENVSGIQSEKGIPITYNPAVNVPLVNNTTTNKTETEGTSAQNQLVLPIFETSLELQNPIEDLADEYSMNTGDDETVGYFEIDDKLHKGYITRLTTINGKLLYITKVPNITKGFERSGEEAHVASNSYYVVFPNGKTFLAVENNPVLGGLSQLLIELAVSKMLEGNPLRVNNMSNEKTLLFNPNEPATASLTGAAYTTQKELAVIEHDDEFEDEFTLRKIDKATEIPIWDLEKELNWLNKVLPQLSENDRVKVVNGLIKVGKLGILAWGLFDNGIITLSDIAAEGTTYHEAFHVVFNLLLDQSERQALYDEARRIYGEKDNISLEEDMAEGFREYVMTRQNRGLGKRILDFFKELFIKVTNWNNFRPSLISYYQRVNSGEFAKKSLNRITKEEKESILNKAKRDSSGKLLAPNGNPSNLSEELYAVVRTKAFKSWFGDWENNPKNSSKVVDENGEPLVVYHTVGDRYDDSFTIFDTSIEGDNSMIYSTDNFRMSDSYARGENRFKELFLNIRNPYTIDGEGVLWNRIARTGSSKELNDKIEKTKKEYNEKLDRIYQRAYDKLGITKDTPYSLENSYKLKLLIKNDPEYSTLVDYRNLENKLVSTRDIERIISPNTEYDGIIFKNIKDYGGHLFKESFKNLGNMKISELPAGNVYATRKSEQQKLTTSETFSPYSPNIRYRLANGKIQSLKSLRNAEKVITFNSLSEEVKETLINKGFTEEKFNSISQKEKEHALRCAAF